jgi:hypothetical protein
LFILKAAAAATVEALEKKTIVAQHAQYYKHFQTDFLW